MRLEHASTFNNLPPVFPPNLHWHHLELKLILKLFPRMGQVDYELPGLFITKISSIMTP